MMMFMLVIVMMDMIIMITIMSIVMMIINDDDDYYNDEYDQEWNVVKKNKFGRKQERVFGVDGKKVYNSKKGKCMCVLHVCTYVKQM